MNGRVLFAISLSLVLVCGGGCSELLPHKWHPIKAGKLLNVSGLAVIDWDPPRATFLVAHDNKGRKVFTARVSIEEGHPLQYNAVDWVSCKEQPEHEAFCFTNQPNDLEALTRVPGKPTFVAVTSKGRAYEITIDRYPGKPWDVIHVQKEFDLPNDGGKRKGAGEVEGFALQTLEGNLLAVWGARGEGDRPGKISWGLYDPLSTDSPITWQKSNTMNFTAPWPSSCRVPAEAPCEIRHVSDLAVDGQGRLFASATVDPGDDGPFDSAVYVVGQFKREDQQIILYLDNVPLTLCRIPNRKVEALEIVRDNPLQFALGTDDENMGGALTMDHRRCQSSL